jgi:drug/metabolite transporter (DMT)-like permease
VAQPFLSGLLAVPLLGESLPPLTLAFLLAVVGSVWMGQRARL